MPARSIPHHFGDYQGALQMDCDEYDPFRQTDDIRTAFAPKFKVLEKQKPQIITPPLQLRVEDTCAWNGGDSPTEPPTTIVYRAISRKSRPQSLRLSFSNGSTAGSTAGSNSSSPTSTLPPPVPPKDIWPGKLLGSPKSQQSQDRSAQVLGLGVAMPSNDRFHVAGAPALSPAKPPTTGQRLGINKLRQQLRMSSSDSKKSLGIADSPTVKNSAATSATSGGSGSPVTIHLSPLLPPPITRADPIPDLSFLSTSATMNGMSQSRLPPTPPSEGETQQDKTDVSLRSAPLSSARVARKPVQAVPKESTQSPAWHNGENHKTSSPTISPVEGAVPRERPVELASHRRFSLVAQNRLSRFSSYLKTPPLPITESVDVPEEESPRGPNINELLAPRPKGTNAPHINAVHVGCFHKHSRFRFSRNNIAPVACMLCFVANDNGEERYTCSWCTLRVCSNCRLKVERLYGRVWSRKAEIVQQQRRKESNSEVDRRRAIIAWRASASASRPSSSRGVSSNSFDEAPPVPPMPAWMDNERAIGMGAAAGWKSTGDLLSTSKRRGAPPSSAVQPGFGQDGVSPAPPMPGGPRRKSLGSVSMLNV